MKIQAFNPFCRVMSIYRMRSLMYSEAGCMSTEVMTGLTGKIFA